MTEPDLKGDRTRSIKEEIDDLGLHVDEACKHRIHEITEQLSIEREPLPLEHLVTVRRLIHFLALRAITSVASGRACLLRYYQASQAINEGIQRAVQSGKLQLRNGLTGMQIDDWHCPDDRFIKEFSRAISIRDEAKMRQQTALCLYFSNSLGHLPNEGVAVRLEEFEPWAKSVGLVVQGEMSRLLKAAVHGDGVAQRQHADEDTITRIDGGTDRTNATAVSWVTVAQGLAFGYIERHRQQGLFPTQADVCSYLEDELRERAVYGPHKRPVSASYIQRNAIQGEWWKKNKP